MSLWSGPRIFIPIIQIVYVSYILLVVVFREITGASISNIPPGVFHLKNNLRQL